MANTELGPDFSDLHFAEEPKIKVTPPGPKSKELLEKQKELESSAVSYPRSTPLAIDKAKGATLKDLDGNIYLDFFGGAGVLNAGQLNPAAVEAVEEQMKNLVHALDFPTKVRTALAEKLLSIAPGELGEGKVFFTAPTGSDAVEAALKLAMYNTGRRTILAFQGSYHGMTQGALSASSGRKFFEDYQPTLPQTHFAPYPYPYRCPFDADSPEECGEKCLNYVRSMIEDPHSGMTLPAAMIVEPVQGEGGSIVPPENFLPGLREIADQHDIPLIFDEIQASNGRCGETFSSELTGTVPDIMTIAKGFGGIGFPLGAIIYREELDNWESGAHIGTFRGHQIAMASGLASLEFMEEKGVNDHVKEMEEVMLSLLKSEEPKMKFVGESRGKGLMIGVEFVKDKETKEPYPEMAQRVQELAYKKGVIFELGGHYSNVIRCLAPLILTENMVRNGTEILIEAIKEAQREV